LPDNLALGSPSCLLAAWLPAWLAQPAATFGCGERMGWPKLAAFATLATAKRRPPSTMEQCGAERASFMAQRQANGSCELATTKLAKIHEDTGMSAAAATLNTNMAPITKPRALASERK